MQIYGLVRYYLTMEFPWPINLYAISPAQLHRTHLNRITLMAP
jgi:hypothetical protein